jgi:hypothetical protein
MRWSNILGIFSLIVLISVIVFAFRQGQTVRKPPEGVPPERFGGSDGSFS